MSEPLLFWFRYSKILMTIPKLNPNLCYRLSRRKDLRTDALLLFNDPASNLLKEMKKWSRWWHQILLLRKRKINYVIKEKKDKM